MRNPIWIFSVIVLAICVFVLLRHESKDAPLHPETTRKSAENQRIDSSPGRTVKNSNVAAMSESSVVPSSLADATNSTDHRILEVWQTPIDFYGKVVDQNSNPISGARIEFTWMELPEENGSRYTSVESDSQGLFHLLGQRGPSLQMLVSKEGYYPRKGGEKYGPSKTPLFSAEANNPVIFVLKKKGEGAELITSEHGMRLNVAIRLPRDGAPVRVDVLEKKSDPEGPLEISQIKPLEGATNWSFRLSIPSGGLIQNQDEFQFEAPERNYQPTVEYHFTRGDTNWTTQLTKQFYMKFGEPAKYGWLRIESNLGQETVFLTYAINPDGSRNLEPKQ